MAGPLPVKGTEISSVPCSVQRAAGLLRRFLSSEAGAEVGIAKGYIEAVAQSLEEMLARRDTEELSVVATSVARSSKFFNLEQMQKVPEVKKKKKKKSREEKEAKKDAKDSQDQAMVDFEALLGHELDEAEANGFEEKSAVTEPTSRRADSVDESPKRKKKKKSSVGGEINQETLSDPDVTKSAKKEKKKKSVDGALVNGDTPAKAMKVEESGDDGMTDTSKKKKKKKHSSVADSEVQQGSSAKKKSKKRASEESPVVKAFHF